MPKVKYGQLITDFGMSFGLNDEFVPAAEYEAVVARCGDLQEECDRIKEENGNMDSMYQDRLLDMEAKVNKAVSECDRLKAVLVKISEWGCNGQCYELVKTLCPCCIAKQALEVDGRDGELPS